MVPLPHQQEPAERFAGDDQQGSFRSGEPVKKSCNQSNPQKNGKNQCSGTKSPDPAVFHDIEALFHGCAAKKTIGNIAQPILVQRASD